MDSAGCQLVTHAVTCQTGDVFDFVAPGHPSLDFAGTVAERGTADVEQLIGPREFSSWLVQAGLLEDAEVSLDELATALVLREAIFQGLVEATSSGRLSPGVATIINEHACRPTVAPQIRPDLTVQRRGDVGFALADLARDFISVLTTHDRQLLRQCDDQQCTRFFIDRSRAADRRWCGMKNCGDRAKAAAYRERRRHPNSHS